MGELTGFLTLYENAGRTQRDDAGNILESDGTKERMLNNTDFMRLAEKFGIKSVLADAAAMRQKDAEAGQGSNTTPPTSYESAEQVLGILSGVRASIGSGTTGYGITGNTQVAREENETTYSRLQTWAKDLGINDESAQKSSQALKWWSWSDQEKWINRLKSLIVAHLTSNPDNYRKLTRF
jgi:hypothetical protein